MSEEFVRVRRTGHLGHLTLDRPRQLNALTLGMITAMRKALLRWENDPEIRQILIDGAGDRGFCAGGDIRVVHDSARDATDAAEVLWREEYLLDALIGDYGKPVVVLMDGITMGGGIGLGGHASHRVVTERSVLAMPEVNLGIAPDVGGSLLFARAPGVLGRHLAMTGARFGAGDAIHCGFADVCVDSADLPALSADLAVAPAEDVVKGSVPPSPLSAASWISECYATDDAATILQRLREVPEAATAVRQIEAASPLAVRVALAAVGRAASLELPEVLDQDLRAGLRLIEGPDPVEGIRAVVVDKAHRPRWSAPSVAAVRPDEVERCFEDLGDRELRARQRMRA
ncbi:enoyl-CoA hydratase/isomerase family protein [Amycolatopsis acidicola]|uniref:3-hydroxyisobutyryl-CoA hydrolase n=1 Tax=Amycolatopsis acidicola TaxID=2596893 RepID=A0A5N0V8E1_9PSEU|nr:3-hydroxyisobutyryl-CoA hydrolase [Amycolatopsis acidicola]KAA9162627.1 enoyl-CoA hydratase/isomerase family protein [Amycolatopsis acidicola]